jgi:hypothetical protein
LSHRTENSFKSKAWRHVVASLLILSWINVAAQPCLMAMETGGDTATAAAHQHGMHADHDAADPSTAHCDHCPPAGATQAERCADGINADCGDTPAYSAETRKADFKVKGVDIGGMPSGPPGSCSDPDIVSREVPIDPGLLKRTTAPALAIQFCVFLK